MWEYKVGINDIICQLCAIVKKSIGNVVLNTKKWDNIGSCG